MVLCEVCGYSVFSFWFFGGRGYSSLFLFGTVCSLNSFCFALQRGPLPLPGFICPYTKRLDARSAAPGGTGGSGRFAERNDVTFLFLVFIAFSGAVSHRTPRPCPYC